ncbi:hypothetical protein FIBSPDRAFT_918099 [Athelia psychrophila]|uniref:FAD-binding domain-containing protein n=1 Tax=Athelia psychrophila TaxID=1759441 RepID=A0A166PYW3_9AGAM|nr:hypothetical protein FIBSPDRAFT_918099 [Fibularhizoctonia sp. CBS 109695]
MSTTQSPSGSPAVIIVGAGPAGLVAALTLLQNGISVRVIEKDADAHIGQRGAGIQVRAPSPSHFPRTLEAFHFLGVLPDILQHGTHTHPMQAYDFGGHEPLKTWETSPRKEPTPDRPYPNGMHIGQERTQNILISHLEKYACHVEFGTHLQSFEQHPNHVVVHLLSAVEDGREVPETVDASFLLGSDGARGVVRKQLGLTFLGESRTAERFVTGDIRITGLDLNFWRFYGNADKTQVSLRPAEDPTDTLFTYSIWGKEVDYKKLASDRSALLDLLRAATGRPDLAFDIVSVAEFGPNVRMVNKFGEGRVFVAGDAAHVHSPTGGQGLNSSIQDALNLAWKLSIALRKKLPVPNALLDSYTAERLPVITEMLTQTTVLLDKTFQSKGKDYDAWKRGGALHMFGVNYRGSPIVVDQRTTEDVSGRPYSNDDGKICAGDRAPSASRLQDATGKSVALFDVFKPSLHTILIFSETSQSQISEALQPFSQDIQIATIRPQGTPVAAGVSSILEDKGGHAYDAYAVVKGVETIVVIRPDGAIGAIVFDVEGLRSYFRKIFEA